MTVRTLIGDCREVLPTLPAETFDCIVTSPPSKTVEVFCAGVTPLTLGHILVAKPHCSNSPNSPPEPLKLSDADHFGSMSTGILLPLSEFEYDIGVRCFDAQKGAKRTNNRFGRRVACLEAKQGPAHSWAGAHFFMVDYPAKFVGEELDRLSANHTDLDSRLIGGRNTALRRLGLFDADIPFAVHESGKISDSDVSFHGAETLL